MPLWQGHLPITWPRPYFADARDASPRNNRLPYHLIWSGIGHYGQMPLPADLPTAAIGDREPLDALANDGRG